MSNAGISSAAALGRQIQQGLSMVNWQQIQVPSVDAESGRPGPVGAVHGQLAADQQAGLAGAVHGQPAADAGKCVERLH
eukprot:1159212-Pelagomonas_calceolata.AAC.3